MRAIFLAFNLAVLCTLVAGAGCVVHVPPRGGTATARGGLDGRGIDRQALVRQVGTDAVVSARVVIGAPASMSGSQGEVEVFVRYAVDHGPTLVWASKCRSYTSLSGSLDAAISDATRCALSRSQYVR